MEVIKRLKTTTYEGLLLWESWHIIEKKIKSKFKTPNNKHQSLSSNLHFSPKYFSAT